MIFIRFLVAVLVASMMDKTMAQGSYWAVYNATAGPAAASCLIDAGKAVDASCCTGTDDITYHDMLRGNATCFSLGPGLIPFSGCVDDGVAGYGENCDGGEGAVPFVAKDGMECGCDFNIEGTGCYKANDIPGQQWFVFLDGDECKQETSSPTAAPDSGTTTMMSIGMLAWASLFVLAATMI